MNARAFRCDNTPLPAEWTQEPWDEPFDIRHWGADANLALRLQPLTQTFLTALTQRSEDLVRIAAYAYAADQSFPRGGETDIYGHSWVRHFGLGIPVSDPDFWRQAEVREALAKTLGFVSGDWWEFSFSRSGPPEGQLLFPGTPEAAVGRPNVVMLFSGGADSLCATLDTVLHENLQPVLVSHWSTPPVKSWQTTLVDEMRRRLDQWAFPQLGAWIHRRGGDPSDDNQRTRSFLFACLGTSVATSIGVHDVRLPDNGVVSLNLPINRQLVGTRASRSTHPKFISLFNALVRLVFESASPQVSNPLAFRTRAEVLRSLVDAGMPALLQDAVSCAHTRGRPTLEPHCGVCSQYLSRRFASMAAGLEEHDLAQRYGLDIFHDPLPPGHPRLLAISFVNFAADIESMNDEDLWLAFEELNDAILPDDPDPLRTANRYVALLRRHARGVLGVMEQQVVVHKELMASGALHPDTLLALVASGARGLGNGASGGVAKQADSWIHSEDYRSIVLGGVPFTLTTNQAVVVEMLDQARLSGVTELSHASILERLGKNSGRLRDVFRSKLELWGKGNLILPGSNKGMVRLNLTLPGK